jgi:hypothetical protein
MSGIQTTDKTNILFKKFQGYANTDNAINNEFQENARPFVMPNRIFSQDIPSTAPALNTATNITVSYINIPGNPAFNITYKKEVATSFSHIVKYTDVQLFGFSGKVNNAFYYNDVNGNTNLLQQAIPSNYDSAGSYGITVRTNGGVVILPTDYSFDYDAGLITFYNYAGVSQLLPPKVTFWRYEGIIGIVDKASTRVAIGQTAGSNNQAAGAVAIGNTAGQLSQDQDVVAIGSFAGSNFQRSGAVAVGFGAGRTSQQSNSISVGRDAGSINQGSQSVAIGQAAGSNRQGIFSVAIGDAAGQTSQGNYSVALGDNAGQINQRSNAIAIGLNAGSNTQGAHAIAIGQNAGLTSQSSNSIVLNASSTVTINGTSQGLYVNPIRADTSLSNTPLYYNSNTYELVRGPNWSQVIATTNVDMGTNYKITNLAAPTVNTDAATKQYVDNNTVSFNTSTTIKIGSNAGSVTQGQQAVAIGLNAGSNTQGSQSIAIGQAAGSNRQGIFSVAIGDTAGQTSQGNYSVALGDNAGQTSQGSLSIAIGNNAGQTSQSMTGDSAIAIGNGAGNTNQGTAAVAIGALAGSNAQGSNAVAIGALAGSNAQGSNAIAIGVFAGQTSQSANSIVINASGAVLNASSQGFYVNPVRSNVSGGVYRGVYYDTGAKELVWGDSILSGNISSSTSAGGTAFITNAAIPTQVSGYAAFIGSAGSPNAGRMIIGDGTGWNYSISGRSNSVTTDLVTFKDDGTTSMRALEVRNPADIASSLGISNPSGTSYWKLFSGGDTGGGGINAREFAIYSYNSSVVPGTITRTFSINITGTEMQLLPGSINPTIKIGASGRAYDDTYYLPFNDKSALKIGFGAGLNNQGLNSIAIGSNAASSSQGSNSIAVGDSAGQTSQESLSVAIGSGAGQTNQKTLSVAIGRFAGQTSQGTQAVAVGRRAGISNQALSAVAIGNDTAYISQGTYAIAIGDSAGYTSQGSNSIAIGQRAGETSQAANSIVLNAQGTALNNKAYPGFFVAPIREFQGSVDANGMSVISVNSSETELISYVRSTKEIVSNPAIIAHVGSNVNGYTGALHFKAGGENQGRIATGSYNSGELFIQGSNSVQITGWAGSNTMAEFNTQSANTIHLFNSNSTTPTLNIRGTGGIGRVYDTVYNKPAVVAGVPTGTIVAYAGDTTPDGWLPCDGSTRSRTAEHSALVGIIGNKFGNLTEYDFYLPDLRNKFLRGKDNSTDIGATGGSDTKTLTIENMPAHSHETIEAGHVHPRKGYWNVGSAGGNSKQAVADGDSADGWSISYARSGNQSLIVTNLKTNITGGTGSTTTNSSELRYKNGPPTAGVGQGTGTYYLDNNNVRVLDITDESNINNNINSAFSFKYWYNSNGDSTVNPQWSRLVPIALPATKSFDILPSYTAVNYIIKK